MLLRPDKESYSARTYSPNGLIYTEAKLSYKGLASVTPGCLADHDRRYSTTSRRLLIGVLWAYVTISLHKASRFGMKVLEERLKVFGSAADDKQACIT